MFVNFALNRDARLRDALKTAMREVAAVDYKAIAQHFNNQFATEEPPIMTSAGYVQANMDREERSMSMSVTAGPGVPASMSISRSMSVNGDGRHGDNKRRRKGQNVIIACAADIDCTSKRDLAAFIFHISQVHGVVIRCHRDVSIRRADLKAKWQDSWAPIVVSPNYKVKG